jgi:hypothetical protein
VTANPYTRLSAASGVLFLLAFNLALFDLGPPPKASDSARKIAAQLVHSHGRILHGMYLAGLAVMLGVWFFATVHTWLGQATEHRQTQLASSALAAGLFAIGLGALGMILFYGAAYKVAGGGASGLPVVRALTDAGNAAVELTKFPLAAFLFSVSLAAARSEILPAWFTRSGFASCVVLLASAIPLFAKGSFTQFGGGLDVVGAVPGILWIFTLSILLAKERRYADRGTTARAAPGA